LEDYCAEMLIPYEDMLDMTWREFAYVSKGYEQRTQRNWDYVRNIMANQFNSSGFSKKKVKPIDIMTLPFIDVPTIGKVVEIMPKKTLEKMMSLFKNK
jgi:hypothetical protein